MKARKRGRVTPKKMVISTFDVYGDERGPLLVVCDDGKAWAFCCLCRDPMPVDFEHPPDLQVCGGCLR